MKKAGVQKPNWGVTQITTDTTNPLSTGLSNLFITNMEKEDKSGTNFYSDLRTSSKS
jgi:hypothetical protein